MKIEANTGSLDTGDNAGQTSSVELLALTRQRRQCWLVLLKPVEEGRIKTFANLLRYRG